MVYMECTISTDEYFQLSFVCTILAHECRSELHIISTDEYIIILIIARLRSSPSLPLGIQTGLCFSKNLDKVNYSDLSNFKV